MNSHNKTICIFGGTGFLGHYVVQELARAGYRIKIATRIPESAYKLKIYGGIGQIVPFQCNYNDAQSINDAVKGCYGVINLVGILYSKGKNNFQRTHVDIPEIIAKACDKESIKKFIHVSALGIEKSKSKYARSKLKGEEIIKEAYPSVTILRPSVVFGAGDNFFNMFARLSTFSPVLPLIGGGKTKFQPVYVGDIADSVLNIMEEKSNKFEEHIFELGGPEIVTFKEIYDLLLKEIGRQRRLLTISWGIAKIQGILMGLMPRPLLTLDQVKSLKTDNIVNDNAKNLADLGIEPTAIGTILPQYLACYRRGGRFADKKYA